MTSKRRAPRAIRALILLDAALLVGGLAGFAAGVFDGGLTEALKVQRDGFDDAMSDAAAVAVLLALVATAVAAAFAWFDRRPGYVGLAAGLAIVPSVLDFTNEVSIRARSEVLFDQAWSATSYALLTILVLHLWTQHRSAAPDATRTALEPAR